MVKRQKTVKRRNKQLDPETKTDQAPVPVDTLPYFQSLPDELVLKVFARLATLNSGVDCTRERDANGEHHTSVSLEACMPHAGLRQYPFLGQVCKRWHKLLTRPDTQALLWQQVVVDFGQELVTAVHRPMKWSDVRPSNTEFKAAYTQTKLSAGHIMNFVAQRAAHIRKLVLLNSEGYWSDDGEFVSLRQKHNFTASCFGVLLGMLHGNLEELRVQQCNSLFSINTNALDALACTAGGQLRRLHLLDLHLHMSRDSLALLGSLSQLEELTLGVAPSTNEWGLIGPVAMTYSSATHTLPETWAGLQRLRRLALRGHTLLRALPDWLPLLPLESFELAKCCNVGRLSAVSKLTSLHTLVLQGLGMVTTGSAATTGHIFSGQMPDLSLLTGLTSLCLADNSLSALPLLTTMRCLETFDMSGNIQFEVKAPLSMLSSLPELRLVDLRNIHMEQDMCWSEAKCVTMSHVALLAKNFKRRQPPGQVLFSSG